MSPLLPLPPTFAATVAALHSVAEQIVAPAVLTTGGEERRA